jgi:hypothetical protein
MAKDIHQIRIESILGGISQYSEFSNEDQVKTTSGIDPDHQFYSTVGYAYNYPSGYVVAGAKASIGAIGLSPANWIESNPKNGIVYVYDAVGSIYSFDSEFTVTALGDLTDGGTSSGNGCAYMDNYIYFARDTTVARYGPLNGSPTFTDDYWVGVLSKTALSNTQYPNTSIKNSGVKVSTKYPNHVLYRSSNGKLYFTDVVGGQGVLHCISTTKTTVEGDTDDGSTYNAIDFPYGMYPTSIASYGNDQLMVALYEGSNTEGILQRRAKIAFWDVSNPDNYSLITNVEFPDPFISAIINSNGVLYTFSGEINKPGVRICRFVGGYSFEQVKSIPNIYPPAHGNVDALLNMISFGASSPTDIYRIGSSVSQISDRLFSVVSTNNGVTCLKHITSNGMDKINDSLVYCEKEYGESNYILYTNSNYNLPSSVEGYITFRTIRIGQPFKITKIRLSLLRSFQVDQFEGLQMLINYDGNSVSTIAGFSYLDFLDKRTIIVRPNPGKIYENNFSLGLYMYGLTRTSTAYTRLAVMLPIVIDYELFDD